MSKNKKTIEEILSNTEFIKPESLPKSSDNCDAEDYDFEPSGEEYIDDEYSEEDITNQVSFIMEQIIHFAKCTSSKKVDDREILEIHMMDSKTRTEKVSHLFTIDRPIIENTSLSCGGASIKSQSNIGNLCLAIVDLHLPRLCMACQSKYWKKGLVWKEVIDAEMNEMRKGRR